MPPHLRPMKHIDRKDLYTNLETRIQYLHSFLDFSSRDIEALITGSKYIKALIPALVNIVYHKLLQYDITARAFQTRSTSYEGPVDENLSDDSPIILHRKTFLRAYLNKLCSDPSTMEFWYYLDKVGMMHVGRGREHPLHIEYVHIGACLSFIQDTLTEALLSHPRLRMERKVALVKALGKVIWIQNDLFAKWCKYIIMVTLFHDWLRSEQRIEANTHLDVRDGDEFADEAEAPEIEREGYLFGKRMLDDLEEEDEAGATSACPFSGLAKGVSKVSISNENGEASTLPEDDEKASESVSTKDAA
ncbi:Protoglobin-domain-containing protein [Xylaria bambusicola]|uniref:Protoglobin-domain-containing protein n=1 Tax=Xylaria bambusicola TaxID=326684 RepID=UPI0020088262|nr:Protoglobin-domain-containing protein [Xylaria bambusicola]KAI0528088.1 Protoglobin-domain-containing protein [Xylaria bambusicola]